jgi:hypothetical protein
LAFVGAAAERALAGLAIHGGTTAVLQRDVTRRAGGDDNADWNQGTIISVQ